MASPTQDYFDKKLPDDEITKDELYEHFMLDKNQEKVTKKNYDDHIKWHCNNREFNPYYKFTAIPHS